MWVLGRIKITGKKSAVRVIRDEDVAQQVIKYMETYDVENMSEINLMVWKTSNHKLKI